VNKTWDRVLNSAIRDQVGRLANAQVQPVPGTSYLTTIKKGPTFQGLLPLALRFQNRFFWCVVFFFASSK
jgi:hypothetical protein